MQISNTISAFTGVVVAARAQLADVDAKIEAKNEERRAIVRAAPHTDDIIAVFMGGLKAVEATFTEQFGRRLNDTYVGSDSAKAVGRGKAVNLLQLEPEKPDQQALLTRSLRGETAPPLNVAILTYFLRDRIADELPQLVDRLCPDARAGLREADRTKMVAEIDAELASLKSERDRIMEDLDAARAALSR